MSPLNSEDLHRIFEQLDKNGDNLVSLDELNWLLERIGVHTSLHELESLVGKTSLDLIDFLFFCDTIIKPNIGESSKVAADHEEEEEATDNNLEADLAKAFNVFDLNGDGFISYEELQSILSRLGLWDEHNGRDCKIMIQAFDSNSDGLLDFEEFKNMMLVTNS
ncbi:probable calcium-binding protein CML44 [Cornus florida]|uniref:probable calcium-binding protein CML44 n=1 Tax=Cornus florida TaxID=4283 RepID=UPI002897730D|nr:probable calcium-binding protein CML44 [Cornus florida]